MSRDAPTQLKTIRDILRYTVSRFNAEKIYCGHGTQNTLDEAAYLILHTLHLPLDQLEPFLDAHLVEAELNTLLHIIERRCKLRIPAAYLTNEAWLQGYRFYIDERAIIPRSFIAELLKEQFNPWITAPSQVNHVLDLCTGSACLAIIAAEIFPNAQIDAVDISADALQVAKRNVAEYHFEDRVHLYQSDLFTELPEKRYDLIISNPPYVNETSLSTLPPEYKHEPSIALAGGKDGMAIVRSIIRKARPYLQPEGLLVIEVGHEREATEKIFPEMNFTWLTTSAGDDAVFLLEHNQLA